jgi:DNA-binding NarL/FixJ family response regulator
MKNALPATLRENGCGFERDPGVEAANPTFSLIARQAVMTSLKAFIVEDSAVIRENLIAALEELAPVRVVGTAADEPSAVSWLSEPNVDCDLMIIDVFLKSGSGLGVLRAATAKHRPMRLVVLSNYATPDMRRKCLELGASRVFDKSNEIDSLILYCAHLASGDTGSGEPA